MYKRGEVSSTTLITVGVVLILLAIPAFVIGLVSFSGGNADANISGTSRQQAIDPTDPQTTKDLETLRSLIDPATALQDKQQNIDTLQIWLIDLEAHLATTLKDNDEKLGKARDLINDLKQSLDQLKALGTTPSQSGAKQAEAINTLYNSISTNSTTLTKLVEEHIYGASGGVAGTIATALALVAKNQNGAGIISYTPGMRPMFSKTDLSSDPYKSSNLVDLAKSMDCSGFISYALIANKVISSHLSTAGLRNERGFTSLNSQIDLNADNKVDPDEIRKAVEGGILKPGDLILSGINMSSDTAGKRLDHVVMVVGSGSNGLGPILFEDGSLENRSVVQSTNRGTGKNGPQTNSLAYRASLMSNMQYGQSAFFLRPNY